MLPIAYPETPDEAYSTAAEEVGELTEPAKRLIATLEMIPLARFLPVNGGWVGRPLKARLAIASAFVAKAIYGFSQTRQLLVALQRDAQLRRICGWERADQVPHESTFSRAFAEFAGMDFELLDDLSEFVHPWSVPWIGVKANSVVHCSA